MSDLDVRHDADRSRYEIFEAGRRVGSAEYELRDGVYAILHTTIDPSCEGRGLGSVLVRGALDDIRESGGRVLPVCPFVPKVIRDNPEYADLVPEAHRATYGF